MKYFYLIIVFIVSIAFGAGNVYWNNGGGTNNWNANANWSTGAQPNTADTAVFDGTSTASCTLTADENIKRILVTPAYTGNICLNGYTLTTNTLAAKADTFNSGGSLTFNGTLQTSSNGGAIVIQNFSSWLASPRIIQTGGNATLNVQKDISNYPIKIWQVGQGTAKRTVFWSGNAGYTGASSYTGAVSQVKINDSTVLNVNANLVIRCDSTVPVDFGAACSISTSAGGGSVILTNGAAKNVQVEGGLYKSSTGLYFERNSGAGADNDTYNLMGNISVTGGASAYLVVRNYSTSGTLIFKTNDYKVTANNFYLQAVSGSRLKTFLGSSQLTTALFQDNSNAACEFDSVFMGTSIDTVAGNITMGTNKTVVVAGTSKFCLSGTGTITSNGAVWYDIVRNGSSTTTLGDSLQCRTLSVLGTGAFNQNGKAIRASGDVTFDGSGNITLDARQTLTAKNTYTISTSGTLTATSLSLSFLDTATINMKQNTSLSRIIFADNKKYTWTAGDTTIISAHSLGEWDSTTWVSSSPGSQYFLSIDSDIGTREVDVTDCKQYSVFTVYDTNGTNGGNNVGWEFPTTGAPTITVQPVNDTALDGTQYQFYLTATSTNGELSYQWYMEGYPVGLSNDTLTGTATLAESGNEFYCIVTDENGSDTSDTVLLIVYCDTISGAEYAASPVICTTGIAYSFPLTYDGGTPDSIINIDELPAGLVLDSTTGTISGTPTTPVEAADYEIVLWSECNNDTATINIEVQCDTVKGLDYADLPAVCSTGTKYTYTFLATNDGGTPDSFTVDPALPAGLLLNKTSGTISGTPTTPTAKAGYQFIAWSDCNNDTIYDTLTVELGLPDISYTTPNGLQVGTSYTFNVTNTGGEVDSFIPADLPSGLSIDTTTGQITGSISAGLGDTVIATITAYNEAGDDSFEVVFFDYSGKAKIFFFFKRYFRRR